MSKAKPNNIQTVLQSVSTDALKAEIVRRRDVERAKRHIASAEEALIRAQEKLKQYQSILKENGDET